MNNKLEDGIPSKEQLSSLRKSGFFNQDLSSADLCKINTQRFCKTVESLTNSSGEDNILEDSDEDEDEIEIISLSISDEE
jgi:hypothetical protein